MPLLAATLSPRTNLFLPPHFSAANEERYCFHPSFEDQLNAIPNRGDRCWHYAAYARFACRAPRLGRAIKIYSELCQRAHDLNDAITIAIAETRDEAKKDAILKAKEKSIAACAKDACRPFNNDETLPITRDP
ncbi:hypothetical protein BG000_006062 [Podila horticola]|nr:hypothetical protein BG000_006062 [Podila horticola]